MKNIQSNLSNVKSKVDKLDVDKLVPVPVDLSKLSDVIKIAVVRKDVYNAKKKNIQDKRANITNLATNTDLNAKINEVKGNIPSINNLATTAALNAKTKEFKDKIPSITKLATAAALTIVESKIPNVSNLVKKTDYNTKISETENEITTHHDHDKYITIQEFNKLTSNNFTARIKQANLASKMILLILEKKPTDFDNKLKNVTSNKNELNELSKKFKAISAKGFTKDLINEVSFLNEAKYFSSRIFQNYLVYIPAKKYIKSVSGTTRIDSWKSNGMTDKNFENITKSDSNFAPTFVDYHLSPQKTFNEHCFKKNNIYIPKKV